MFDINNVKYCLNGNAYNGISSLSDKCIQDFALGKEMTCRGQWQLTIIEHLNTVLSALHPSS